MAGASSKLQSQLRCCTLLGSSTSLRRLLSSPTPTHSPRLLASLNCSLPLALCHFKFHRQFSGSSSGDDSELWRFGDSTGARIELDDPTTSGLNDVANRFTDGGSIFPVESLIWLLDHYHDITGFPWLAFLSLAFFIQDILLAGKLLQEMLLAGLNC